jgi:lactoylglutathione lyase
MFQSAISMPDGGIILDIFFILYCYFQDMYIDHLAIWAFDLERVKEFFLNYFDCTVNEKYVNSEKHFSSYFISFTGGTRIEIMNRPDVLNEERNENDQGLAHLAINVGKRSLVDNLTERIRNDGYIIVSEPRITGDGYYESVILDPEGNRIEILSDQ